MTDKEREYYKKKYRHLNLYFAHGRGWDILTLTAATILDELGWPQWMPNWMKRLNNYVLYAFGGRSIIKITWFYHNPLRKLFPFLGDYSRFSQIKEKYGSLRLYTIGGQPHTISILETASYNICEECGTSIDVGHTEGAWVYTRCKECYNKIGYKNGLKWKINKNTIR